MDKDTVLRKLKIFLSTNESTKLHLMQHFNYGLDTKSVDVSETSIKYALEELDVVNDRSLLKEFEIHLQTSKMPSFSETLLKMIDKKNMKDSDVYRRAGIDRRLFSKIRSDDTYRTSKRTIFSLIIAMGLTEYESCELLEAAGFTFSMSQYFDLIIIFFVRNAIYDIDLVNYALTEHEIHPLASIE